MINKNKNVTAEQLDEAVKASYSLGLIDGRGEKGDISDQLKEMTLQLRNMLTTNKQIFKQMLHPERHSLTLTPRFVKVLLDILCKAQGTNGSQYCHLKKRLQVAIGASLPRRIRKDARLKK